MKIFMQVEVPDITDDQLASYLMGTGWARNGKGAGRQRGIGSWVYEGMFNNIYLSQLDGVTGILDKLSTMSGNSVEDIYREITGTVVSTSHEGVP